MVTARVLSTLFTDNACEFRTLDRLQPRLLKASTSLAELQAPGTKTASAGQCN